MNPLTSKLIEIACYSVGGFLVGASTTRIGVQMHQSPRWWPGLRILFGLLLVALSAATVLYGVRGAGHDRAVSDCQAQVNERLIAALKERGDASSSERDAQRRLLTQILDADTATAKQKAIRAYLLELDRTASRRDSSPLPTAFRCG